MEKAPSSLVHLKKIGVGNYDNADEEPKMIWEFLAVYVFPKPSKKYKPVKIP